MDSSTFGLQGENAQVTILPITALLLVVAIALILVLPRKYAVLPFILASLFIPLGQVVMVGTLHFPAFRILVLAGWVRVITSGILFNSKTSSFTLNSIDRVVIAWVVANVIVFTLLSKDIGAFIYRMGFAYTAIGVYFLMRLLIRNGDDVERQSSCFLLVAPC